MIIEELMSVVTLHPSNGFTQESLFLRSGVGLMQCASECRSREDVWDGGMTGDANSLAICGAEPFSVGEPDIHPIIEVFCGGLEVPPATIPARIIRSC